MPEQDPLAQLRDIHLPEAISAWPPAPGWWLLAIVIILLTAYTLYQLVKYLRRNRYRRQALVELAQLTTLQNTPSNYLQQLNYLLKQTTLTAHPTSKAASFSGQRWLQFLDESGHCNQFSQGSGKILAEGPYAANITELQQPDIEALHQLCKQWIKQHRIIEDQT